MQKETLSPEAKNLLENLGFNPFELDFLSEEPISDNAFISQAFVEEKHLLKKHEESFPQVDPLNVFDHHVKVSISLQTTSIPKSRIPEP